MCRGNRRGWGGSAGSDCEHDSGKVNEMKLEPGWQALGGAPKSWIEAAHKMYDDGPDVIISIWPSVAGYEVRCSSESRTSGPSESTVGIFASLEEARDSLLAECKWWDQEMLNSDPSLRGLAAM